MPGERLALGLVHASFLTSREKLELFSKLDNLESLTVLSIEDLCMLTGRVIKSRSWNPESLTSLVDRDQQIIERYSVRYTRVDEPLYPPLFRELYDPPFMIFWRGELPDPEQPLAAIVGTRSPTGHGAQCATRLAAELGCQGVPVVSGLARGIDSCAHKGVLGTGGKTIAVLACGVERLYPRCNAPLGGRIIDSGGCVLSEYPPGDEPMAWRFPQRNRLISGLSRSVIIVEAPARSGALITARYALEQGRDVWVAGPCLHTVRSEGIRNLRAEGARRIDSVTELLCDWGLLREVNSMDSGIQQCNKYPVTRSCIRADHTVSAAAAVGRQMAFEFEQELELFEQHASW